MIYRDKSYDFRRFPQSIATVDDRPVSAQTNDRLKMLDQIQHDDPQFVNTLLGEVHAFGKRFSAEVDERWSLIDCGLTATHWEKLRMWARSCHTSDIPSPGSLLAGLLLLLIGSAVARSLDKDEPLWHKVAESCSQPLRQCWFSSNDYPIGELRGSIREVCGHLGIRNQLDLRDKHRYWRTIQLQFGFSAKVAAARLPFWLAGYSVPETIRALLSDDDPNRSTQFCALWSSLTAWNNDQSNRPAETELLSNIWYPREAHTLIKDGLAAGRDTALSSFSRLEDEEAISSVFGVPRFRNGEFQIGLASILPSEISRSSAPVLTLYVEGIGLSHLARDDQGNYKLDSGYLSAPTEEMLDDPTREVSVSGRSGVIYKERFSFWPPDSDLVLFRGSAGRLVTKLEGFVPEPGRPFTAITSEAVELCIGSAPALPCETRSRNWKLHSFPDGCPDGLEARIEELCIWSPVHATSQPSSAGFSLTARERSITSVQVTASAPPGWAIQRVRFAGKFFQGAQSVIPVSPASDYLERKAQIYASQAGNFQVLAIDPHRIGPVISGAAVETEEGEWTALPPDTLDAGVIAGRRLAIRWDNTIEDPWLTLGQVPLVRDPNLLRRQGLQALGEPLELRFGLMNERIPDRVQLSSSVYSSGILADVNDTSDLYLLKLREEIEAAPDLRVWVWEYRCPEPRLLDRSEVEAHSDNRTLSILQLSVGKPLGWAVSLEGSWLGGRFHANPGSSEWQRLSFNWISTLADSNDWSATAVALRWWRFPVLMDSFRPTVEEQVEAHPLSTLLAWTGPSTLDSMAFSRSESEFFMNPIRTLLWRYVPSSEDVKMIWASHGESVLNAMEDGKVELPALLLLWSHPVLLARIAYELLSIRLTEEETRVPLVMNGNLFQHVPDPAQVASIASKYRSLYGIVRDFVERCVGVFAPDMNKSTALLQQALSDLRSWKDRDPLDEAYFREHVVRPAEALFDGLPCETARLQIAVARSRACCAYLASHLLATKGIRDS